MKTLLQELVGITSNMNNPSHEPMSRNIPAAKDTFTGAPGTQGYLDLGGEGVPEQGGTDPESDYEVRFRWFKQVTPRIEEAAMRGLASTSQSQMREAFREILTLVTGERDYEHGMEEK